MSDIKYDPELPYVVYHPGTKMINSRFKYGEEAFIHRGDSRHLEVIDTTPKPKIPEDAEFIIWEDGAYLPQIAQRDLGPAKLGWRYGAEDDYRWYSSEGLSREIGDVEVTVLVRKEDS